MAAYQQLAALLAYPTADLPLTAVRCAEALATNPPAASEARSFAEAVSATPAWRLEEVYSATFDLSPACCPYLGHHLFGENPKRAVLMVRLKEEYQRLGLEVGSELPDHLCLVLRFLACTGDQNLAAELTAALLQPGLAKMISVLAGRQNPYVHALRATLLAAQAEQPVAAGGGAG